MQRLFHVEELVALALHHLRHRNSGCARDDFGDFLGADLRAQQLRLLRLLACELLIAGLQLCFELRQLAVLQLAHLLPVALAPCFLHLHLDLVDLFLDVLCAGDLRLLGLPYFVHVSVFAFEPRDLFLDRRETFSRCLVFLLFHRLALDLELNESAVETIHCLGL